MWHGGGDEGQEWERREEKEYRDREGARRMEREPVEQSEDTENRERNIKYWGIERKTREIGRHRQRRR